MNLRILQLVLVLVVEHDAILVEEAHHRGLPPGRPQEINDDVEEPVVLALLLRLLLRRGTCRFVCELISVHF